MRPVRPVRLNIAIHPILHRLSSNAMVRLALTGLHFTLGAEPAQPYQFSQHLGMSSIVSHRMILSAPSVLAANHQTALEAAV